MKKLLTYLSSFAPDISGACAVLFEMGGITVICDAGGCTGNICGFDEPRWGKKPSALFSAGLRDMDAILGRDDRLAEKLAKAVQQIGAPFTAIVGTPVPAVIATDFRALERICEKKTGVKCISVDTYGAKLYDKGAEAAYLKLFCSFTERYDTVKGRVGVIGATPLDTGMTDASFIKAASGSDDTFVFGMDSSIDDIIHASSCEKLLVISHCGIKAAQYLRDTYGIPYETACLSPLPDVSDTGHTLIIHEQFTANALRRKTGGDCASFFDMLPEYMQDNDIHIDDEDALRELILTGGYDTVIADISLKRAVREYSGRWVDFPHFAVSGRL